MANRIARRIKPLGSFAFVIVAVMMFAFAAAAQTPRPTPTVRPSPTPGFEPAIVSRADDFTEADLYVLPQTNVSPPVDDPSRSVLDLENRIRTLEASRPRDPDAKQRRLLLNLEILTKAEQRAEGLRKQLYDLFEKESALNSKLATLENDMRPEMIERSVAFAGTLRPDEMRETRRKNLTVEREGVQNLLNELQSAKSGLDLSIQRADAMVERLRTRLEKEIDDALDSDLESPDDTDLN
ncbi:MAG: hypothetical protein H0V76_02995 [Blastocatellia bacterium]|nr:hypothetical protein [Blastocatellia bacterium]